MRIVVTSVFVEDQEKALSFYTEVLGFQKKTDVPVGEDRWLTVVSPEEPEGVELLLEPSGHPAVKPFTSFAVEDVDAEHARLEGLGVKFTQPPTTFGDVTTAVFDDTCGNLIQIAQTWWALWDTHPPEPAARERRDRERAPLAGPSGRRIAGARIL